jgi:hypothetical protein
MQTLDFTIGPETATDQMKLRSEDQDWLKTEIAAQISNVVDQFKPKGFKKFVYWLRDWGIVGTNIAIIFALLAMTLTAAYYAFSRVSKEATFEANTGTRLDTIEAALKLISAQIVVAKYSSIPPQELKVHRDELNGVKQRLASINRNTPNFWPTTFQVINLLSKAASPIVAQHPIMDLTDVSGITPNVIGYPPGSVIKLHKRIENSTFTDAIVYLDSNVILHNVTFINWTLVLPEVQNPPTPLQEVGNQLLSASDLSHIVLAL